MSLRPPGKEPFVPLDPAPSGVGNPKPAVPPGPPALKVLSRTEGATEFKPLDARSMPHAHGPGAAPAGKPVVTFERDGDKITGIRVECACGQVIELACVYGASSLAP